MVDQCANPTCSQPLHYLREGRIFVFDLPDQEAPIAGGRKRRLQHFWLCGPCSETLTMVQTSELQIRVASKPRQVDASRADGARNAILPGKLAS